MSDAERRALERDVMAGTKPVLAFLIALEREGRKQEVREAVAEWLKVSGTLWILRPQDDLPGGHRANPWEPWYDKSFGFVVRAATEDEARRMASAESGGEGPGSWLDPKLSACEPLPDQGDDGIVMRDFARA